MTRPATRRRDKLAPDPVVRRAILAAASKSVREQGVRGLSIATVLDRAQLSTRAFYRHFESKDRLLAEFAEFLRETEKIYRVVPDFKLVVADIHTLLSDLRRWMEQSRSPRWITRPCLSPTI